MLEYDMVAVNEGVFSTKVTPFGVIKELKLGREGSQYVMGEYTEMKYILLCGLDGCSQDRVNPRMARY